MNILRELDMIEADIQTKMCRHRWYQPHLIWQNSIELRIIRQLKDHIKRAEE